MKFKKIALGYYAFLFVAFGLVGLTQPILIAELVHLSFESDIGHLDFVAMYGGLFFGIGVFMMYCLKENIKAGLVCVLCTMGFMLVARSYMFLAIDEADLVQYIYLAGELFTVLLVSGLLFFSNTKTSEE